MIIFLVVDSLFKPWTTRYSLPTLDHQVPFANSGPLGPGILCQPWTTRYHWQSLDHFIRYFLPIVDPYTPFTNPIPVGTLYQYWITWYLFPTQDHQVPFDNMNHQLLFANHGPLGIFANLGRLGTLCQLWNHQVPIANFEPQGTIFLP